MKNIALCFDNFNPAGNAAAFAGMLRRSAGQLVWTSAHVPRDGRRPHRHVVDAARRHVVAAYDFLADSWEPGDHVFIAGAGRDGVCARAVARLIGTVGVLPGDDTSESLAELRGYLLSVYAMPRTVREHDDWQRVRKVVADLRGQGETSVAVRFLGLWDTRVIPGMPRAATAGALAQVEMARHALSIDARVAAIPLGGDAATHQDVWFRGGHGDVTRGRHSCAALSDIALDWVLDGAVDAGIELADPAARQAPSPIDALAGSAHAMSPRRLPGGAAVHASVECYLRAHPSYWRRLPAQVEWADPDWVARGERLMASPATIETPAAQPALVSTV
ncbi:DUF2235 domain-containing protein [Mycobacterium sp. PSTR-4-N]|uniref:phospholipase effector Tle1 domain-containing protein n=1 Tax=Mycobacterium sp. PSTR-4-N TaxID=2917745 RepID=UPI001F14B23D|nr:DUF2235 domain-containing protein [Mycobacterium sp. PSTR-4-N]MCG7595035.1 DUF2235 domain-containing protein [Mycobacterium sp. PSTR-4-N]